MQSNVEMERVESRNEGSQETGDRSQKEDVNGGAARIALQEASRDRNDGGNGRAPGWRGRKAMMPYPTSVSEEEWREMLGEEEEEGRMKSEEGVPAAAMGEPGISNNESMTKAEGPIGRLAGPENAGGGEDGGEAEIAVQGVSRDGGVIDPALQQLVVRAERGVAASVAVVGEIVEGLERRSDEATERRRGLQKSEGADAGGDGRASEDGLKGGLPTTAGMEGDLWVADGERMEMAQEAVARDKGVEVGEVGVGEVVKRVERDPYQLSPRQARAIDLMLRGFSMNEVAQRIGVTRRTVHRWRYNHPTFITVYSRLTSELEEQTARRAEGMAYRAMDIVGGALEAPDDTAFRTSVALRVLGQLRLSKFMFERPGEELFLPTLDQVIRRRRMAEGVEADAPIGKAERNDELCRMEKENETEES